MTVLNGVLPIDKPVGPTSHDIVARARRTLGVRRIGHTGTLDPFASGLLLLCIGPATRLAEYLTAQPKAYEATLRLGFATETDDHLGRPLSEERDWSVIDPETLRAAFDHQKGELEQTPPLYSAKKIEGERMYEIARRGGTVAPRPVAVTISRLVLTRIALPEVDFEVECSSGTYIRAIARDVGEEVGLGAHLTRLRRTEIGRFSVESALRVEDLEAADRVATALITPAAALAGFPQLRVGAADAMRVRHGGSIAAPQGEALSGPIALLDEAGELLAIGEQQEARVQPRKVFS